MHWFIINTEAFSVHGLKVTKDSAGAKKSEKTLTKANLPRSLLLFLDFFHYPYIILDESSKIKTTDPCPEHKKSTRCRLIKTINDVGERSILTGTLKSKSPVNVYDQFAFLDPSIFPESIYEFAERYCIMITIRVGRGRRVRISQKDYKKIRDRLVRAWNRGGAEAVSCSKASLFKEYTISYENLDWIMAHKEYTPFVHQDELYRRIAPYTMVVKREDIFDIKHEHFVHNPIRRYVTLSKQAVAIGEELINLGFTDNLTLSKAAALELTVRLQDVCNGFEPVETFKVLDDGKKKRIVEQHPLPENPKIDCLMELLEEIDVEENQVAIVASRLNILGAAEEALEKSDISFVRYSAETAKDDEAKFVSGEAQVFVSTITQCAYGLNSLGHCDYMIALCEDGRTEEFYQLQHRLLRGQLDHPKFMYVICVKHSIEERILTSLAVGEDLINDVNTRDVFEFD